MRYGLMLFAIVATAQQHDPRGFVNERLLRQAFAKNQLTAPRIKPLPLKQATLSAVKPQTRYLAGKPQESNCAMPLLAAGLKDADPKIVAPGRDNTGDEKMIVPTIPVCPAK
jgi:hypothetical protein